MKTLSTLSLGALLLSGQQAQASPLANYAKSLVPRQTADAIVGILESIAGLMPDGIIRLWEIEANPQMCKIYMESKDGANCKAYVECDDGKKEYNSWNVCYVGGRQYFHDPRMGDFSITFTTKDGTDGQGLTSPVLQLKDVADWTPIPVSDLASIYKSYLDCEKNGNGAGGPPCDFRAPYLCYFQVEFGALPFDQTKGRRRRYMCGVPKIGKGGGGLDSNGPENDAGFAPGWCVAHVIQYQKQDGGPFNLQVSIKDNNENQIGGSDKKHGPQASIPSKLPVTLELGTGAIDKDPVTFAYGDQAWDSNDKERCSVGGYEGGKREMDCGFSC